jgi:hypothetical protein
MAKLNQLENRFETMDEVLTDEFTGVNNDNRKLREAHEALKAQIETIPEDIAKLSEIILRDLLEEHDVTDIHKADSERLQITLNSLAKLVREHHASGAAAVKSIHDQLSVLKDSVAGIESRLTSVAKNLEEKVDMADASTSSPTKQSIVYGLLHDILSPLGKVSKSAVESGEKEDLATKNANQRGSVKKQPSPKRGKGGPVLMYSPDGSLDTGSRDTVEQTTEKAQAFAENTAGRRQTEDQAQVTEKETAPGTAEVPPAVPAEPVHFSEREPTETASACEAAPSGTREGQTEADTAAPANDVVPPHIQAEGESSSKAADAEEVASALAGPIKRYGMVDPEEKATIYRDIEMHFRSLRLEAQGLRQEYQSRRVTVNDRQERKP